MLKKLLSFMTLTPLLTALCQGAQNNLEEVTEFETINVGGYKGITKITTAQLKAYQALHTFDPERPYFAVKHHVLKKRSQTKALPYTYQDPEEQQKKEGRLARRAALLSPSCTDLTKKQEEEIQQKLNTLTIPDRPASPKARLLQEEAEPYDTTSPYVRCTHPYPKTTADAIMQEEQYPLDQLVTQIKDAEKNTNVH